jgi:hypothetical protein
MQQEERRMDNRKATFVVAGACFVVGFVWSLLVQECPRFPVDAGYWLPLVYCAAGTGAIFAPDEPNLGRRGPLHLLFLFAASGALNTLIALVTFIPGYVLGILACWQVLSTIGVERCLACVN